jgi:hypothetical protein
VNDSEPRRRPIPWFATVLGNTHGVFRGEQTAGALPSVTAHSPVANAFALRERGLPCWIFEDLSIALSVTHSKGEK